MTPKKAISRKTAHPGHAIEDFRDQLAARIRDLERQAAELERRGCRMAYIHFKWDRPRIMFLLEPTEDGRRKYIHVGVDPSKQKAAREQIERHERREKIRRELRRLYDGSARLRMELDLLEGGYRALLREGIETEKGSRRQLLEARQA